jgi:UDP-N-acetylmuramoyl-tripeptide--D-alanyl-D-alanine ligase
MFSRHFTSVDLALPELLAALAHGDAVMVKGSNGVGLSRLVAAIKDQFQQR